MSSVPFFLFLWASGATAGLAFLGVVVLCLVSENRALRADRDQWRDAARESEEDGRGMAEFARKLLSVPDHPSEED